MIAITDREFKKLFTFIKENYGINLEKKRGLLEARLSNMLISRGIKSFEEYLNILFKDQTGVEVNDLLNKVTTNHTYFMREQEHFIYLRNHVLPYLERKCAATKDMRIWSAGCSTGQEAYTTAMVIDEYFGTRHVGWDTSILATDISTKVLQQGKLATYSEDSLKDLPATWKKKYFVDQKDGTFKVCDKIRNQVVFRPLNLMEPFPYRKPFDLIFCRNVMIYFDAPTKEKLVHKFYDHVAPGGFFFIGHSESINANNRKFTYIKPAIYQKGVR